METTVWKGNKTWIKYGERKMFDENDYDFSFGTCSFSYLGSAEEFFSENTMRSLFSEIWEFSINNFPESYAFKIYFTNGTRIFKPLSLTTFNFFKQDYINEMSMDNHLLFGSIWSQNRRLLQLELDRLSASPLLRIKPSGFLADPVPLCEGLKMMTTNENV